MSVCGFQRIDPDCVHELNLIEYSQHLCINVFVERTSKTVEPVAILHSLLAWENAVITKEKTLQVVRANYPELNRSRSYWPDFDRWVWRYKNGFLHCQPELELRNCTNSSIWARCYIIPDVEEEAVIDASAHSALLGLTKLSPGSATVFCPFSTQLFDRNKTPNMRLIVHKGDQIEELVHFDSIPCVPVSNLCFDVRNFGIQKTMPETHSRQNQLVHLSAVEVETVVEPATSEKVHKELLVSTNDSLLEASSLNISELEKLELDFEQASLSGLLVAVDKSRNSKDKNSTSVLSQTPETVLDKDDKYLNDIPDPPSEEEELSTPSVVLDQPENKDLGAKYRGLPCNVVSPMSPELGAQRVEIDPSVEDDQSAISVSFFDDLSELSDPSTHSEGTPPTETPSADPSEDSAGQKIFKQCLVFNDAPMFPISAHLVYGKFNKLWTFLTNKHHEDHFVTYALTSSDTAFIVTDQRVIIAEKHPVSRFWRLMWQSSHGDIRNPELHESKNGIFIYSKNPKKKMFGLGESYGDLIKFKDANVANDIYNKLTEVMENHHESKEAKNSDAETLKNDRAAIVKTETSKTELKQATNAELLYKNFAEGLRILCECKLTKLPAPVQFLTHGHMFENCVHIATDKGIVQAKRDEWRNKWHVSWELPYAEIRKLERTKDNGVYIQMTGRKFTLLEFYDSDIADVS
ncbi:hypothetical protein L596_011673 [Steinernema carpocapsae]|uniref:Intermembrane lipid transfer protein VPS13-like C-terminal domain-containing protein n=2 Tax=Steinernema carpocapsae TaxID=34508 RepID=A0A4U5NV33_STECR|nr:hypothetical protein L596_011673 [Steinernema carpocapsae]